MTQEKPILIFGAGAIGCYLGATWAASGLPITLLGRKHLQDLDQTGLTCSNGAVIAAENIGTNPKLAFSAETLSDARLIVLSVKSTALPQAISDISKFAAPETPILCLLNGVAAARSLREAFPDREIIAGMVLYNVVWQGPSTLKRSSVGHVTLEQTKTTQRLATALSDSLDPIQLSHSIDAVQYGKLLLNLNNPVNALSGLTLYHQLRQRQFRRVYAAVLEEALSLLNTAQIAHAKSGPLPAAKIVKMLRAPNWVFNTFALPRQKLDPNSQTSMAQDLASGKPTEIDTLNGEILRIAQQNGLSAPINSKIVDLIHDAENGGQRSYSGDQLGAAIGI